MQAFPIRALTEEDLDEVVDAAGGVRAHPDADRRGEVGADYLLGDAVIELKLLDEEGFDKPERQAKLAELFAAARPGRPVVVLDPEMLEPDARRRYRNLVEQPVKRLAAKARKQLVQSRSELAESNVSVLWIFNNGYTALDHDTLVEIAGNRVRQDSGSIDALVVSGCYYHSDGFEGVVLWPCTLVPLRLDRPFAGFEALRGALHAFADRYMTQLMRQSVPSGAKFEVRDIVFDLGGVRFVRPAPPMGRPSEFYVNGRPRGGGGDGPDFPPVALIVPGLDRERHAEVGATVAADTGPLADWRGWQRHLEGARAAANATKPLLEMAVVPTEWLEWCRVGGVEPSLAALSAYAHSLFDLRMAEMLGSARERRADGVLPSSYALAVTQEIGQDRANDVSDIAIVRERPDGEPYIRPIVEDLRIHHEHAVALAAAYALRDGVQVVRWSRDRRRSWE